MSAKFIFVTGGVVSSLGKGLASASIGCLLEARGLKVSLLKFDPYLNVDPGTMSPFQHGEVFVTDDGAERNMQPWIDLVERLRHPGGEVSIGVVGKYVELQDSYKSLNEALAHGGLANDVRVRLGLVETEGLLADG